MVATELEPSSDGSNSETISFPDTGRTSPRLEQAPGNATKGYIKSADKIRRLAPRHVFPAEIVYVVSPSNVWVRMPNHITRKLELPSANDLNKATVALHMYVMAPIRPEHLGRARILKFNEDKTKAYVYFIDAGQSGVVKTCDLFELPKGFACHPWQTVPLMIHGIDPENGKSWTSDEIANLQRILDQYSHFWVKPVLSSTYPDDESHFISAYLYGLTGVEYENMLEKRDLNLNVGESITELYYWESRTLHKPCSIDGAAQKSFPFFDDGFYDRFEEKFLGESFLLPMEIYQPFHLDNPFPQLRGDFESTYMREGHTLWAFTMVSDLTTIEINKPTPNRFFAHRLDNKKGDPNDVDRFRRFATEGRTLAKEMAEFYLYPQNQHCFDFEVVYDRLKSGERVFGVVPHERRTAHFTMQYQRVEILQCIVREEGQRCFYRGRFLDTGGIETFLITSVYHIHPDHMTLYPLSYVLYFSCLSRPNKFEPTWNDIHLEPFNEEYLRPNKVFLVKLVHTPGQAIDLSKPLHVESMVSALNPESKSVEDLMVENRHAIREVDHVPIADIYEDLRFPGEIAETELGMIKRNQNMHNNGNLSFFSSE